MDGVTKTSKVVPEITPKSRANGFLRTIAQPLKALEITQFHQSLVYCAFLFVIVNWFCKERLGSIVE